jgi:hypothetical protein
MGAALLLGAGTLFVNQAAVSAILVATLDPPDDGLSPDRLLHALIGGGVGLLVGQVLFPRDPVGSVIRAAEPVFARLASVLDATAQALATGDERTAERALSAARSLEPQLADFEEEVAAAREVARLSPARRRARPHLRLYADAVRQVDLAVRNTRVLARAALNAVRSGVPVGDELPRTVQLLADAVRALGSELADPPAGETESRRLAHEAAQRATAVLEHRQDLAANVIVAQVRATATDLLRGSGLESEVARDLLGPWPAPAPDEVEAEPRA